MTPADRSMPGDVMLARAVETIAETTALPGGTTWEPKWDGYRAVLVVNEHGARILSRRGTDLTAALPDLATAAAAQVPAGTVLDGEAVVWSTTTGTLDFSALQRRVASPRTAARLAREQPASYAAFDVLEHDRTDLRPLPHHQRRAVLAELAAAWAPPMTLSPSTSDIEVAAAWFRDLAAAGIEGLVAKGGAQPYRPGRRDWLKVKHRSVLDVVCAAVIGPAAAPGAAVAGLPIDGELRIVGRTTPLSGIARRDLARQLAAAGPGHPWPAVVPASAVHGFGAGREPITLTLVDPLVIEVSADTAWSGRSFRHPLRFVRVRPELYPEEVSPPR
ncbi:MULTISPECIES: ATP-dependent DNA ligase [unclassified Cellulomonas]|uniref:ATP-dependent DNA ligase n=1 Tax=unclassified Cellulomonas TaxID=2620175 RepID=UPI001C4F9E97|nr:MULTISPECIES: ATP-dependent DNA ligase [unclassified Cellulomonas]MBW0254472.1 ATP-dependent DNA ligase [Cellulomonas sp. PS-H5]MCG7284700.1 ATP-dependent DNA ligase [Cellulomonas sp. ACRRI]